MPLDSTATARFWSKVNKSGDCWLWTAATFRRGYGAFWLDGTQRRAHRVAYELANGPIPDALLVLHTCDNPRCVNPAHLIAGTGDDNMADMVRKGRACRGERNNTAILTAEQVAEARAAYVPYRVTVDELAARYGLSRRQMGRVLRDESWGHLDTVHAPHRRARGQ